MFSAWNEKKFERFLLEEERLYITNKVSVDLILFVSWPIRH